MYPQRAIVARAAAGCASAASGRSQIAYQGTSQAVASRTASVAQPAAVTHERRAARSRQAAPQKPDQREGEQQRQAARVKWTIELGSPPVTAPSPSASFCGTLQRVVRSWFWPIRTKASKRLPAERGERRRRDGHDRRERAEQEAPAVAGRDQHERRGDARRCLERSAGSLEGACPRGPHRKGRRALPAITSSMTKASLWAPPTTWTSTSGFRPTASAANTGSDPSRRAQAQVSATIPRLAAARTAFRIQKAAGTPSFASGSVTTVKSGP